MGSQQSSQPNPICHKQGYQLLDQVARASSNPAVSTTRDRAFTTSEQPVPAPHHSEKFPSYLTCVLSFGLQPFPLETDKTFSRRQKHASNGLTKKCNRASPVPRHTSPPLTAVSPPLLFSPRVCKIFFPPLTHCTWSACDTELKCNTCLQAQSLTKQDKLARSVLYKTR